VSDIIWAAQRFGALPRTRITVALSSFSNFFLMAGITYLWLRFVTSVVRFARRDRPVFKLSVLLQLVISAVALILTYIIAPDLIIGVDLELGAAYTVFQISVPILYLVAVLFFAVRKARSELDSEERKNHLSIGIFPFIVLVGGLLQVIIASDQPIFCFSCTILMIIFYIRSMDTQISLDPLTGLNNRGQLRRYCAQDSSSRADNRQIYVMMLDVNDFKSINDTYGHAEGDRALVIVADALKKVTGMFSASAFLGRYGGDEFIMIVRTADEREVELLISAIRDRIENRCRELGTPFTVVVGIGYDRMMGDTDTFAKCIQRADKKLYLDKEYLKLKKRGRAEDGVADPR
jgi:diguanylate cyclase (GGDEF)-like protein